MASARQSFSSIAQVWSSKFTTAQNAFRVYLLIVHLMNGFGWLFLPASMAAFSGIAAPTSYGLAFLQISTMTMLTSGVLVFETTDKKVIRNHLILALLLFAVTRIVAPAAFFPHLYFYGALDVLGIAIFHLNK